MLGVLLQGCAPNHGAAGVGGPIRIVPAASAAHSASDDLASTGLVVVSWNVHEGRGDVARLMASLTPAHVVLLLQEATRETVTRTMESLGLFAAYVPSMPSGNTHRGEGAPGLGNDRGSAIASTLPISQLMPTELPWVYQRRVVVMGTIHAHIGETPIALRVVSVHLDNRPGRNQQAAWLASWLQPYAASGPLIVGGDLNTWFGVGEDTVRAIDAVVPRVRECGDRPTFRLGRRLDHLFATASALWRRTCEVLPETFGSDHHPIVLRLLR